MPCRRFSIEYFEFALIYWNYKINHIIVIILIGINVLYLYKYNINLKYIKIIYPRNKLCEYSFTYSYDYICIHNLTTVEYYQLSINNRNLPVPLSPTRSKWPIGLHKTESIRSTCSKTSSKTTNWTFNSSSIKYLMVISRNKLIKMRK